MSDKQKQLVNELAKDLGDHASKPYATENDHTSTSSSSSSKTRKGEDEEKRTNSFFKRVKNFMKDGETTNDKNKD